MSTKTMVRSIVKEIIRNAEMLSKQRWSGVTKVENFDGTTNTVYRIPYTDVFARALHELAEPREIAAMIEDIPRITFDYLSLWFTISTKK